MRRLTIISATLVVALLFSAGASAQSAAYTYDSLNRLTRIVYADGKTIVYTYDAAGNRITKTVTDPCPSALSATTLAVARAGGTGTVDVTTPESCSWTAASNADFITVTGGASGTGNGTVTFGVSANETGAERVGTLTIAGHTFTVTQDAHLAPAITTPPGSLTVTAGQNATFTVVASGTPAPTYRWQVSSNDGGTFADLSEAAPYSGTTTATLTITAAPVALNGRQYRVVATNSVNFAVSGAAILTVRTSPGAPSAVTANPANGQANVNFSAPASDGGSAITSYTATSSPGAHTGTVNQAGSGTITVTGLTNGTAYTFTVTATNAVGTSAPSAASNSVTPATVPGAPPIGTATAGNAQASVPFSAPASNGGSAIISYTATSSPGGHTGTLTQSGSGTITVTGLTNGIAYTFTVTATNAIGTSMPSAASNVVTPAASELVVGLGHFPSNGGWLSRLQGATGGAPQWTRMPWDGYNAANGETRVAMGDLDGDGLDEVVVGLGAGGAGWLAVLDDAANDYALLRWIQVAWPHYVATRDGSTWPAVGDLDGDGRAELVVGLGSGSDGWVQIFDDATTSYASLGWRQLQWAGYNALTGETHPAVADLDGDGRAEIVLGTAAGGSGYLEVLEGTAPYAHRTWIRVNWAGYNTSVNGPTFPAAGDLDGDGRAELVIGLGPGSHGWLEVRDDANAGYASLRWLQVPWDAYNLSNGQTHPAIGNLDADARLEIAIGLGVMPGAGGWVLVLDDMANDFAPRTWLAVAWAAYVASGGPTFPAIGRMH